MKEYDTKVNDIESASKEAIDNLCETQKTVKIFLEDVKRIEEQVPSMNGQFGTQLREMYRIPFPILTMTSIAVIFGNV